MHSAHVRLADDLGYDDHEAVPKLGPGQLHQIQAVVHGTSVQLQLIPHLDLHLTHLQSQICPSKLHDITGKTMNPPGIELGFSECYPNYLNYPNFLGMFQN